MRAQQEIERLASRLRVIPGLRHQVQQHGTWCTLAAASMLREWAGRPISQDGLNLLTPDIKHYGGIPVPHIPTFLQHLGLSQTTHVGPKLDDIITHLNRDEPVLAVYNRPFPYHRCHAFVVGGHADREALLIYDPLQPAPQFWYGEDSLQDEIRFIVNAYGIAKR